MQKRTSLESILLILLMCLTVILFSTWGYQSVIFLLSTIFNVQTDSTVFTVFVGLLGMIAGASAFTGSVLWWIGRLTAFSWIKYGSIVFMIKNIFDIINEVAVFRMMHETSVISAYDIQELARILGGQLFQFVFWVFVLSYFNYLLKQKLAEMPKPISEIKQ